MILKNPGHLLLALLVLMTTLSGCTHSLDITNLPTYRNTTFVSLEKPLRVGIRSSSIDFEERNLVRGIGTSLSKYNVRATNTSNNDKSNIDVLADVSISSDYKGSGWNFLINFPGFLVWAPAWHGYHYQVSHNVTVALSDARTGKIIDTVNVPVVLNIRHADINRTWTEISWFEFGAIAFVGGIVFINYDDSITSDVGQKAGPVLSDYIAQHIASSLQPYKVPAPAAQTAPPDSGSVKAHLIELNNLKQNGLITEEEYQIKRKKLIDSI